MTNDLGSILPEIETVAKEMGLVLFHGKSRIADDFPFVEWDTERRTDYRPFLEAAVACGVKLICIHDYQFTKEELDETIMDISSSELSIEERRVYEKQLNNLSVYAGFTCGVELTFDHADNVYFFHLRTPWRIEYMKIVDAIDDNFLESDEGDEPLSGGGFFSRN